MHGYYLLIHQNIIYRNLVHHILNITINYYLNHNLYISLYLLKLIISYSSFLVSSSCCDCILIFQNQILLLFSFRRNSSALLLNLSVLLIINLNSLYYNFRIEKYSFNIHYNKVLIINWILFVNLWLTFDRLDWQWFI